MNIPESFYIALCMTVLLLGVVYWFWSQNQYIQRKINLLENIVYELKELCTNQTSFVGPPTELKTTKYSAPLEEIKYAAPAIVQTTGDSDLHESLMNELEEVEEREEKKDSRTSTPKEEVHEEQAIEQPFFQLISGDRSGGDRSGGEKEEDKNDDLQPGGVGSGLKELEPEDHISTLESMTVKELRRLAEQRGIENAAELRKKELIAKLKAQAAPTIPSVLAAFEAHEQDELQPIEFDS
jgi:hypothetical protein